MVRMYLIEDDPSAMNTFPILIDVLDQNYLSTGCSEFVKEKKDLLRNENLQFGEALYYQCSYLLTLICIRTYFSR